MMRALAARVLSVETDTAYTLRVRKQPAQFHVRMDAVPECHADMLIRYHGESPMAHGLTSGILVYYSGDYPLPGSSIAGSKDHRGAGVRLGS